MGSHLLSPGPLSQEEKSFFPSSHSLQHFSSLVSSFLYTDLTGERLSFQKLFAVEDVADRVLRDLMFQLKFLPSLGSGLPRIKELW